jgi:hypothetical protein
MTSPENLSRQFDTLKGVAFRVVKTPSGHAFDENGVLPDDPTRWSMITPLNTEAWNNWHEPVSPDVERQAWDQVMSDPEAQYKSTQIRISSPKGAMYKKAVK